MWPAFARRRTSSGCIFRKCAASSRDSVLSTSLSFSIVLPRKTRGSRDVPPSRRPSGTLGGYIRTPSRGNCGGAAKDYLTGVRRPRLPGQRPGPSVQKATETCGPPTSRNGKMPPGPESCGQHLSYSLLILTYAKSRFLPCFSLGSPSTVPIWEKPMRYLRSLMTTV